MKNHEAENPPQDGFAGCELETRIQAVSIPLTRGRIGGLCCLFLVLSAIGLLILTRICLINPCCFEKRMKSIQISAILVAGVLFCGTVTAGATDKNGIVTVESTQSRLQPQFGITYRIAANLLYKTDNPGPAEMGTSKVWNLANEFIFRTVLREAFVLPAYSAGKRKEDDCYIVVFARKGGGKEMKLIVDPKKETVWLGKIE